MKRPRRRDVYDAPRACDAQRATAADMIHLSEGEQWLQQMVEDDADE